MIPALNVGDEVMHNGVAVRLLYRIRADQDGETWRVQPLFVRAEERDESFGPYDRVSSLHTRKPSTWRRAA